MPKPVLRSEWMVAISTMMASCQASPERLEFTELHMGMPVRIVAYDSGDVGRSAAQRAFDTIAALENIFSDYRPGSEVSRLSNSSGPVALSDPLYAVFELSDRLFRASAGSFDPTIAPRSAEWRRVKRGVQPDGFDGGNEAPIGWHYVSIDTTARTLTILAPGLTFDFGGIAKGFILEQAADELKASGIARFLIEAGGEIVMGEPPPRQSGWFIAIDDPAGRIDTLANIAVGSSGDAQQSVTLGETRYSHLIDPKTALPLTDTGTVTVTAPSAAVADGVATAIRVGGVESIPGILREFPAVVILRKPER